MPLSFPAREAWDGSRLVVSFPADLDGSPVRCAISLEALQDHFGADSAGPMEAFRTHRGAVETTAERLINRRRFEQDGSILIRTQDF